MLELRALLLCESAYAASLLGKPDDARMLIEKGLAIERRYGLRGPVPAQSRLHCPEHERCRGSARLRVASAGSPSGIADTQAGCRSVLARRHRRRTLPGRPQRRRRTFLCASARQDDRDRPRRESQCFLPSQQLGRCQQFGRRHAPRARAVRRSAADRRAALDRRRAAALSAPQSGNRAVEPRALPGSARGISCSDRIGNACRSHAACASAHSHTAPTHICSWAMSAAPSRSWLTSRLRSARAIPADSVPAMTIMQVQARIDAARGRFAEAITGLTKIVEFFDGRQHGGRAARSCPELPGRCASGRRRRGCRDRGRTACARSLAPPARRQALVESHRPVAAVDRAHPGEPR